MADWLNTVQQKNQLPTPQPRQTRGASPSVPQNDWLSNTAAGGNAYRPNQLVSEIQPTTPIAPKQNVIAQAGKFLGVTPENVQKAKTFITKEREPITPEQVIGVGKKFFDVVKTAINNESVKYQQKVSDYKKSQNIPEYENLDFEATRDFTSVGMLNLAKGDLEKDLEKLNAKPNKSKLDNYRIKNLTDKLNDVNETLQLQPQQRVKKEALITGLALERSVGNLAAGFLGSLESVANFVKWRSDVAGYEKVASYSEEGAKRVNQWAQEVAPNNPELADELLQGAGSTLTFYIPGAGVSSATARLATISPKLATLFGVTASATLEAAAESGDTYQEALNEGRSRDDADLAASRVFAGNIFFNIVSDKVGLFSDAQGVKKAFTSALAEGSQEAFQQGLQNVAGDDPIGENVGKSFFIGSVVGGGLGSVIDRVAADPTISDEDRKKLLEFSSELQKAESDQEALGKIAEQGIQKAENEAVETAESGEKVVKVPLSQVETGLPKDFAAKLNRQNPRILSLEEAIKRGDELPPIPVYEKDGKYFTNKDGDNRLMAYQNLGVEEIPVRIEQQTTLAPDQKQKLERELAAEATTNQPTKGAEAIKKIDFQDNVTDAYRDQVNGTLVAGDEAAGKTYGYADYSLYGDELHINMIEVEEAFRRKGVATAIIDRLKSENPDKKIVWSGSTNDGAAFIKNYESQKPTSPTKGVEPIKVYRGGTPLDPNQGITRGISVSIDKNVAESFRNNKEIFNTSPAGQIIGRKPGMNVVEEYVLSPNARIATKNDIPEEIYRQYRDSNPVVNPEKGETILGNWARKNGFDAIDYRTLGKTSASEAEIKVLNRNILESANGVESSEKRTKPKTLDKKVQTTQEATEKKSSKTKVEDFPAVASALQSKGAEKIDNFELRTPPAAGTEEFKLHKKVVELIRKYAQTIGEDYKPRNALGVYYAPTKNIRVNSMNNLSVAAHEIAHFLDYANNISTGLPADISSKLGDLYVEYYPGAKPSHKDKLKILEGFATLLQKYVEMPVTISNKYPELVDYFLKPGGGKYNKVVGEILKDLNDIVGEYQGLSSLDKIGARMTSEGTNIDKGSFLSFWDKVRTQIFDQMYPAEVLAKKANVSGTKEDPSLWIRAYQSINGIVNNNISTDRGYWGFSGLQDGFQKKYGFNWKSLLDSTTKRGVTDSFATYLIARREYFYYQELDKLQATRDRLEEMSKAFQAVPDENIEEFDRDMKASLSEDYGIDLTEMEYNEAKEKIQMAFEEADKAYQDFKEILDNDGFSREEVEAAYNENKDRFTDESRMFDVLTREDLDLLHHEDVQLLDNESYNRLKSREGYASFKRQFYDEIVGEAEQTGSVKVGSTKVSSLIRRRGSEKTIINPLFSALLNHNEIVRKSMKQLVYNQIGKIGSSALLPTLFQEVPVLPSVDANGRVSYPQEKDPNLIMAREKYKRKAILTDAQVKATIDNLLSYKNIDTFVQMYTGLSRMFTAGTTGLYPQFALTNFMVDQITATANSYNKFRPLYSPLATMKTALQKAKGINNPDTKFYEEYLVMGGERQTFTGWQKLEPNDLFKRITDEKSKMQKAIALVEKGTDILSTPAAKSELFSRAAEYINARKAGKSQVQALEEAGRVTAPFHHVGAWGAKQGEKGFGQTYVRGLPFFNAALQVIDQSARVAATPAGRQRMTMVTLAVTAAYLVSAMAMGGASDEQKEQYRDLEAADLANFIYFPNPSGEGLIRVKMSNTFSIPGTLINMVIANRMFSARYDLKDAMEGATAWLPTQLQFTKPETILSWLPQIFKPAAYTVLNVKDYPTVSPLVNQGLQRKPAALQFNEGTSTFAKFLGEKMNISPIKIDYLLTGYFGRASGFLTGKPGVYNPASSIMRDYYFTMGRRVREYYDQSEKVNAEYTAFQNWEKGYTSYTKPQTDELYRRKIIVDDIDDRLAEYRDIDVEKEPEKASKMRAEILLLIEHLETGTKPKDFGSWSVDASKRRNKNKPK